MSKRIRIGILGGGQLARMSAYQAYKLGFDVSILEKEAHSPAGQITKHEFAGWFHDEEVVKQFVHECNIITLENEFVNYHRLEFIENLGKKVLPSSETISLIQDKLIQKQTLVNNNIPVPVFAEVTENSTYQNLSSVLGKNFILKSRKMGYDGYGNHDVKSESDYHNGLEKLTSRHRRLLAEQFVRFEMELAVMVARTTKEIKVYPVVQTIQKNHICHTVIAPADIRNSLYKQAGEIAVESVKAVNGFGIFGVEMFLKENEILVNEMAPRPHNSGHYTIEACTTSQFENHIRSVLDMPLGSTRMIKPHAVMINLLGKKEGEGIIENYYEAFSNENVHIHIYGKAKSRIGRKMGHITLLGENREEIIKQARKIEQKIII
ncbi:MAG: 5-(carboxyamino)imidazole ribonucleotide synthase [Ignavibacteriaceae bacterium]